MSSAEASRDVLFPIQSPHISLNADKENKLLGIFSLKNKDVVDVVKGHSRGGKSWVQVHGGQEPKDHGARMNLSYSDSRPSILVIIERLASLTFIFSLNTILSEMISWFFRT